MLVTGNFNKVQLAFQVLNEPSGKGLQGSVIHLRTWNVGAVGWGNQGTTMRAGSRTGCCRCMSCQSAPVPEDLHQPRAACVESCPCCVGHMPYGKLLN
jgi:hypothetical protein